MDAPDGGELWRLALEHSPVGMTLVGLDGRLLVVNRALCDMLGYDPETLTTKGFQELTHPDDLDNDLELFGQAVAGDIDSYRLTKRYLHADGRIVWGDLSVALVRQADGSPLHFISQILDITELEAERRTLEAIFETVNVGLLLIDKEGRYRRMNRRHQDYMRVTFPDGHDGAAGQLGHVYFPDGSTPMGREDMPSFRAVQGEEFDGLWYWVGRDPATRSALSTSARTVRDPSGEMTGAVLAYQDITDLMRALQVKDEFVASVSHELRTPLTSVLGYLELLRSRDDLPEAVQTQLDVIHRNAGSLQLLVSDLLDVAQAREGGLELHRGAVDLAELVRETLDAAAPQADNAGLDLSAELPASLVTHVDGPRVRQVIENLVSNALKYTEPGGSVTVGLHRDGHGAGDGDAVLTVCDTGIGMTPQELEHVCTRFFRGEGALRREIPGTGLGLNIVSSIVNAHGGRLSVESDPARGSRFTVRLPDDGPAPAS
ncbi:PAS domain S-box protein [Nocardioides sp.]|uniref:sensor histidine kinase n=1 Tax=Nocardioides sp. TaxID=35761 RepID=UPI001A22B247|nr:PAS domain S-box protein [Nocardioides sp.]MBJ7355720.1 PAS domain S-box protein [Nocardioides sp.]